ncbi:MAG: SRPBCC family protein [Cyclobacteriaceae bacterium]
MPKFRVEESIIVTAPAEKVYKVVSDFNHWTAWSPWLILEPGVKVDVAPDTKSYTWEGNSVGSGKMKITDEQPNQQVTYDLHFLKPWKSYARVQFRIEEINEGTKVTWLMDSGLPFFLFWMKKQMVAFLRMDYARGLAMLKDYVEDDKVHSELEFPGTGTYEGSTYLGVKSTCAIDTIDIAMDKDFELLRNTIGEDRENISGQEFSIYHKWDFANNKASYTACIPVKQIPDDLPGEVTTGTIPQVQVHTVRHIGPYGHLGNAWSAQYMKVRNKAFKPNKKVAPFEVYVNDPADVSELELVTEVHFPIK